MYSDVVNVQIIKHLEISVTFADGLSGRVLMRFSWSGEVWRVAFAFDPKRQAVLLVGGNKAGANQKRFYQRLIRVADERYRKYLVEHATARQEQQGGKHGKKS